LSQLHVVDLCQDLAGSYCGRLFAAMGAKVIKVEPLGGDETRRNAPWLGTEEGNALFQHLNAGKRGVTLDLQAPQGRKVFRRLVAVVDIVIEAFPPGTMARLGLGYDELRAINDRLIVTSITPFGQSGPYSHYRWTEIGLRAISGEMYLAGQPHQPLKKGGNIGQYLGGINGFIGTMGAVFQREATGKGQHIDVSMTESLSSIIGQALREESEWGFIPGRRPGGLGWPNNIYECKDGYVVTFTAYAAGDSWWTGFAEIVSDGEAIEIPASPPREGRDLEEWDRRFKSWLSKRTRQEVYEQGQSRGLAFGYLATAADVLDSPQLRHRRFFSQAEHPDGQQILMSLPFLVNGDRLPLSTAPRLGEHDEEVYFQHLKLEQDELAALKQQGVV
jgi:crotonobetainyl-CoA:carnitine CoA-transferase CaiB-like acyl-CoA transferase